MEKLFRKIEDKIEEYLKSNSNKVLIVEGARQIGKSYIIRDVGTRLFNDGYIEINMVEDSLNDKLFANIKSVSDFYLQLSMLAGSRMIDKEHTLVFIDEIQVYPELLTLLKFLKQDDRFTYIASGSLLGVTLSQTTSIPMGSIEIVDMYPLDFEEFLYANGFNKFAIDALREKFNNKETLDENTHNKMLDLFKKYILIGGLPDAVKSFVKETNIVKVRNIHNDIYKFYGLDASKYDEEHKLKIRNVYDMIPSCLENKKKRIVFKDIEPEKNKNRYSNYVDEFDYLVNAGIALDVNAISTPIFPLIQSASKNLLKLYLNDVGLLTNIYYKANIKAVLETEKSINLGIIYESVVASELKAHGHKLYYYDNKSKGEVDFLIDDYNSLSVVPLEIKSGKDYKVHSALNLFVNNDDYSVKQAFVLSNEREVQTENKITYMPIYNIMFF